MTTETELPTYADQFGVEHGNPWVNVVFVQGVDEVDDPDLHRLTTAEFLDWDAIGTHLAQWDYGDETDHDITDVDPRAQTYSHATWTDVEVDGMQYILTIDRLFDTYSLDRRPMDYDATQYAHVGHPGRITGSWFCDTCSSPVCDQS